ncbi:nucleoside hydrolase [Caulobacter sp. RHG1]|uniref:nucleoside hydrolase n=1 Tax=Caulobacter sp. (strain RHG1) TaxID=2545762 RepID=UPI0019D5D4DD|nr:nucleoside hydrolase [Caulobacter sp. RHG1]NQE64392.1 Inosine-uridine preferring nucleoside hydrolase [Caulobacter sp. RHG1]
MKQAVAALAAIVLGAGLMSGQAQARDAAPTSIILDTDMWGDIDDALALAMLHALQDRGEARILAVTSSTDDRWCAAYVDLLDTAYGRPGIPVGLVRNGVKPLARWAGDGAPMDAGAPMYTEYVAKLRTLDGTPKFPHSLADGDDAPEAVALLRKTLAAQPDASVVVVAIGFSTNLARLLASGPDAASPLKGRDLVRRKVRLLSIMAGRFADARVGDEVLLKSRPEYNIRKDIPSARALFRDWPTPIVASGAEVGFTLRMKGADIQRRFARAPDHPIPITYRYMDQTYRSATAPSGALHDHKTFDLTSVLYAVRPDRGYFSLSGPGAIKVLPDGVARFEADARGSARYLTLDDTQRARALEAMTALVGPSPLESRQIP